MSQLYSADSLPDFLEPYRGKLSSRFYEVRKKLLIFIEEVIRPKGKIYKEEREKLMKEARMRGQDPLTVPQPKILSEMRREAKRRGLWNFFLPEVSGLTVRFLSLSLSLSLFSFFFTYVLLFLFSFSGDGIRTTRGASRGV